MRQVCRRQLPTDQQRLLGQRVHHLENLGLVFPCLRLAIDPVDHLKDVSQPASPETPKESG